MIKRFLLLSFLLYVIAASDVFPQSRLEIKKLFYEAESWILFEDYKEALPIYQQLLKINPANSNYKYRIGQCYINTPGEKEKAVSYLEDAVKDIDPKYAEGKFSENSAPFDAYYYLANAYRINNQIDKAIETYKIFRKNLNPAVYDSNIVTLQIQSCLNARDLMQHPLFIRQTNLSGVINESNSEFNPVVSDNEDMIVFSRSTAFYDAILYSVRSNGAWSGPMNMNEILKVDQDLFPTSLSKDGKTLYLYSSADYDGIIYSSHYENGSWSPIVKLNDNINTKYWESHATISHDNKKLYFTSNRKGSLGGLDIYVSERDSTGDWGAAKNLGPVINTPYNEESPFLSQDDKTIFFSSRGHFNMGGYDIFYSTLQPDGTWSVPLNAGYPLNTTDDDVFFKPMKDGYVGYFSKEGADSYGKQDIYRIEIFSDNHPRKFLVRGIVKVADLMTNFIDSVKISAMNIKNPNQVVVVYSNPKTGEYEFEVPHGNYEVTYQGDGTKKVTKEIDLSLTNPSDSFVLPGTVLPKSDFIADLTVGTGKTISVSRGDSIMFPLKVEPNSVLRIERWAGDSLLSAEEIVMRDSVYNYKMLPGPRDSKIVFKLTDKFNNITTTEVFISRQKEQPVLIRPEYSRIIAQKQLDAFVSMLESRATGDLKKLISQIKTEKQKFGKLDDVLDWLKQEGAGKNISSDEVDRLALKVAVMDNVLTQAAVDYLARHSDGELKKLLEGLNIYESGLKTWTDLQKYIQEKSEGRISPGELNRIVGEILADVDPGIQTMREKVMAYSNHMDNGTVIRESVTTVDKGNIKQREKWLGSLAHELTRQGLNEDQLAAMLTAISSIPGTTADEFLSDLTSAAEEPLASSLNSLDLKKLKIRTPQELVTFLLTNTDRVKYPEDALYKALSNLIISRNVPESSMAGQTGAAEKHFPWALILAAGGILLIIIFFLFRRKKKEKAEE